MEEDRVVTKLIKESHNLLDTGKRTNLTNYKSTYKSTVKFLYPQTKNIFEDMEKGYTFEIYNPDNLDDLEINVEGGGLLGGIDPLEKLSPENKFFNDNYNKVKNRKTLILAFNDKYKVTDALKEIKNNYKSVIEENGFNIAYVAFGFIDWVESINSDMHYKMPILLIPVIIENENIYQSFKIKAEGNDIILNPALCQMLKDEHNTTLIEYDDKDYEFDDLDTYFQYVQEKIKKFGWVVKPEESCLGLFSFNKINMYNDINDNINKIKENENIRRIYGGETFEDNLDCDELEKNYDIMDVHTVVDADSSQLEAINFAKLGKSFVLQGPPGTGKSQTITNIIAEMLYNNKKVLFVSEKMAALNVVYEKLKKEGLEDYCLELHSHKANKKDFIDELNRTLEADIKVVNENAVHDLEELEKSKRALDLYCEELHKIRDVINTSLYGVYEKYSQYIKQDDSKFVISNINKKGDKWLKEVDQLLSKYILYSKTLGKDYRDNTWYGYKTDRNCFNDENNILEETSIMLEFLNKAEYVDDEQLPHNKEVFKNLFYLESFIKLLEIYSEAEIINYNVLVSGNLHTAITATEELKSLKSIIVKNESQIDSIYKKEFYDLDYLEYKKLLTQKYKNSFVRFISFSYSKLKKQIKSLTKNHKSVKYRDLVKHINWLETFETKLNKLNSVLALSKEFFTNKIKDYNSNYEKAYKELMRIKDLESKYSQNFESLKPILETFENPNQVLINYNEFLMDYNNKIKSFVDRFDFNVKNIKLYSFKQLESFLYDVKRDLTIFNKWIDLDLVMKELKNQELIPYLNSILDCEDYDLSDLIPIFNKLFYKSWIDQIYKDNPFFYKYNKENHDIDLNTFQKMDEKSKAINRSLVKEQISAYQHIVVDAPKTSPEGLIVHEAKKTRKTMPIRKVLEEVGEYVQQLKPCFLMSPLSVSTYLTSNIKFDCVIFDEASQIFPYDAIGSIYRANQLIVVGDSQQMPPTNFFNKMVVGSDDDEENSADFESILDFCIGQQFPQHSLKWHYRSKYEDLIVFSNKNYYDNNLLTFPSSEQSKEGIGIDYVHVDGIYTAGKSSSGGTNRIEAEKVVDLIFENIKKYPNRSIGVVAFNTRQQDLIETLLAKKRLENKSCEEYFANKKIDPLFVKNLETVQGDERDTIIFSVTYGRNENGVIYKHFGPLNQEKGERRLNVAITRAKYNVKVVSSMHGTDIDYTKDSKKGVRFLSQYLDLAENGEVALKRALTIEPNPIYDSFFEESVHSFLLDKGYCVDTQVGCSSYRIDLGVRKPNTSKYVLAIECDGASYHSSKTARDRDRLRQSVLESMGWKFYRIWSTDWFRNNALAKQNLLHAVENAMDNDTVEVIKEEIPSDYYEITKEREPFKLEPYKLLTIREASQKCKSIKNVDIIYTIIEEEAPISYEFLLKRICNLYDREKVTSYVRDCFNNDMRLLKIKNVIMKSNYLYINGKEVPALRGSSSQKRLRDLDYICLEEICKGLLEMVTHFVSINKIDLFRRLVNEIGYSSLQTKHIDTLDYALKLLKDKLVIENDIVKLKKQN